MVQRKIEKLFPGEEYDDIIGDNNSVLIQTIKNMKDLH